MAQSPICLGEFAPDAQKPRNIDCGAFGWGAEAVFLPAVLETSGGYGVPGRGSFGVAA